MSKKNAAKPISALQSATKISQVIKLLQRKNGATLDEMMKVTGWQKHTVRASLTGLKKKGHAIERSVREGVSTYSIAKPSK